MPAYKRKRVSRWKTRPNKKFKKTTAKKAAVRTAVRTIMKIAETKFFSTDFDFPLHHNWGCANASGACVAYGNLLRTNKGDDQNERVGDSIYSTYLRIRLWVENRTTFTGQIHFRVMIVAMPIDQANTNSPADFWRAWGPSVTSNRMIADVNTDRYKIIKSKRVLINAHQDANLSGREIDIKMPIRKKIQYSTDTNQAFPKYQAHTWSLVVIPYGPGAAEGQHIGNMKMCMLHTFKDF